jgi:hypothetical protein
MSGPEKEIPAQREPSRDRRRDKNLLTGTMTTSLGAVVMLLAFTMIPDPTLRLTFVSLAGWLIGGSR